MEENQAGANEKEPAEELRKRLRVGAPVDREKIEEERKTLEELNRKPFFRRVFGFSKFTGPGFIQSAVTLGAGSAGSCLIAGSKYGYRFLWIGPVTMILGLFMFFAIAKQAVAVRRRPYEAMKNELGFGFAFLFGLSALLASVIWHFPQYSLAGDVANNLAGLVTKTSHPIPAWILGPVLLGFAIFVTWNYGKGLRGIRVYEKTLRVLVWLIVVAFLAVVVRTGVNWKEFFRGFVPKLPRFPDGSFDREQANLMIAILGATIGVNMVFLYPYSVMARGWGKEHNRLAHFDLVSGMAIPFVLATGFVIMATSNTLHAQGTVTKSAVEAAQVLSPVVGPIFGRLIFGVGMLAIALSTITVHMLMCGFILSEMFGVEATGWRYRLLVLTPAVGAVGVAWKLPFGVAVFASSICVILLPMAYVCFMVLHNKRGFMGEAMPGGGKRIFWNAGMALAIAVVTVSAIVKVSIMYGDLKKHLRKPKPETAAMVEQVRSMQHRSAQK
jgi:Mn2+/Fe2+ NRAMP family transporter